MDLEMEKFILHFGEDPDQKDIYNLIVKVVDISTEKELEQVLNGLKQTGFDIYFAAGGIG